MRILVSVLLCTVLSVSVYTQVLPEDRMVAWHAAGNHNPIMIADTLNIMDFIPLSGSPDYWDNTLLMAQISLNAESGVIYFPPGEYAFTNPITLQSGLVIKGESALETTFTFNLGGNNHLIKMHGSATSVRAPLVNNATKGQSEISTDADWSFSQGDIVLISKDDAALVSSNWAYGSVGQVLRVANSSNDNIILASPLRTDFLVENLAILTNLNPIRNAGVECISIIRLDESDANVSNISMDYAYNCHVRGIESSDCNFSHVEISHSSNVLIENSYFHHGHSYGSGGKAYGVALQYSSSECLVQNNAFEHLRHSVLLQAGANGNVIAYNYSIDPYWEETIFPSDAAGDMVLHGNYPFCNLFEGNFCQNIVIDDSHGINGPNNTFLRNRADLYGIFMGSNPASDNQNFIGNEITADGFSTGLYFLNGEDHFEYGNNDNGIIIPSGQEDLADISYYRYTAPEFIIENNWPAFGAPNSIGEGVLSIGLSLNFGAWPACTERSSPDEEITLVESVSLESFNDFVVYPNPTKDFLFVDLNDIDGEVYSMKISDLQSRIIAEVPIPNKLEKIDFTDLPEGLYNLVVNGDFGEVSKTIIVVK